MPTLRKPAVAGSFYPEDPALLDEMIGGYLREAPPSDLTPKALIAPHAGYVYSGPIAGSAYALLESVREQIQRVILLGPAHRVAFPGVAAPSVDAFSSPGGVVPLDRKTLDRLQAEKLIQINDDPHAGEHSLEVHLPFLQAVLTSFTIVPLVIGQATSQEVSTILEFVWGGPETLILVSSDLSHYLPYHNAVHLDRTTADAIEELRADAITMKQACGRTAIQGLLASAKTHGLHATTLDLRNSGDTAGPRDQVVGYGAFAFS